MTLIRTLPASDRLLGATLVALTAATLVLAAEAHAFCTLFCIHGTPMIQTEICTGQN
jgi:hypothetical protein